MPPVTFLYMYRDGENFKQSYSLLLPDTGNITLQEADQRIQSALLANTEFIPEHIGITSLTPDDDFDPDIDGPWHEYLGLEIAATPTDGSESDTRNLLQLVEDIEQADRATGGWEHDPTPQL